MGLPPNARQYFAQKHIEAAEKHLSAIEENLFKEGQEDRRAFEKFYNNLALFSGGTIALSITYLGSENTGQTVESSTAISDGLGCAICLSVVFLSLRACHLVLRASLPRTGMG